MTSGVLVDTSFLITLADSNRPRHKVAKEYFQHFLTARMPMALSAIVVSEFHMRQNIKTLPLENFVLRPFNHEDATAAADVAEKHFKRLQKQGADRVALKDDFKLLGQAKAGRFGYLITDDAETLYSICEELRKQGELVTRAIKLQGGFDKSHFDPTGQHDFDATLNEPATDYPATLPPEATQP
jgi:predicted nucleic acid-binding protein